MKRDDALTKKRFADVREEVRGWVVFLLANCRKQVLFLLVTGSVATVTLKK